MLTITLPEVEYYDEVASEFKKLEAATLHMEHSLVSLSKWESEWEKPFLGANDKTEEEVIGYVKAMTLTPDVSPETFKRLSGEHYNQINTYMGAKMTATWFNEDPNKSPRREIITSELIYFWMIDYGIPFECENWHLSRLLTLIRVCGEKRKPAKKMSPRDLAARNRQLNEERKRKMGTTG